MAKYISKEYLQFMLNKWKSQYEGFEGENKNSKLRKKLILKGYNECQTIVEQAPTADVVEVKEARWKGAGMGDYYCSLCQETVSGNEFKYCPFCGAKMD